MSYPTGRFRGCSHFGSCWNRFHTWRPGRTCFIEIGSIRANPCSQWCGLSVHIEGKSRQSGEWLHFRTVSDVFCSGYASASGLLAFKKGDILHTDGVPIKGKASRFKSKVHEAVPHSTTFQTHITRLMMVLMLQIMLHKLVVVRTNLLISINWT